MTETVIPTNAESAKSTLEAPGVQLKAKREAMGWSVQQVADQLKLAPRQVIAIEEGDSASLPNMAVVRGFVRAYAKVVKLDAVPLVAMIEVHTITSHDEQAPRRESTTSFSEVRFPSMTQRSLVSRGWFIVIVLLLALVLLGAYKMDVFSSLMAGGQSASSVTKPGFQLPPIQSKSVPLISVPTAPGTAPRAAALPVAGVVAPALPAAAKTPVAQVNNTLVLTVTQDSWMELRSSGASPLFSGIVRAGNTETFDITQPVSLVVGNPAGVTATLRGVSLSLAPTGGSSITRLAIE